jgi:glycosyltransferase involved in cell wall biosynthesis
MLEVFHDYLVGGGRIRQFVIAGVSNLEQHNLYPDLSKITEDLRITDFVHFTGYIPDEDAVCMMNMATGFLYPSAFEGFGYPPLEAMACGTPLICSDAASLPEVVGNGGILCSTEDPKSWIDAMISISENRNPELRESALKQAEKFNWSATAQEFWSIYESII